MAAEEAGLRAGLAFSTDGKARAGMGVDAADYDNSGISSLVVTNFDNEMMGLYHSVGGGLYVDQAPRSEVGKLTRRSLGFGCFFFDADLDGLLDLLVVNGHIDNTIRGTEYAQSPHLFLNRGGKFRDVAAEASPEFARPRVGRGAAFGDFDNDGDSDVLITSNGGSAWLYRNDVSSGNRSLRLRLIGTKSNRSGIGARLRCVTRAAGEQEPHSQIDEVRSGGGYYSQSDLRVHFGIGTAEKVELLEIRWPSGQVDALKDLKANRLYYIREADGVTRTVVFRPSKKESA